MIPVSFGEGCFGWLHPGHGPRGVVLCGSFGHEALGTHRGWLDLAERLVAQGLHVVRFDYHGTGDSSGGDTDPARLAAWRGSVVAAAGLLRQSCGVTRLALVGLRLGAALALLAAEELEGVEALACLAPVVSGRSFLREQRMLARAWYEAAFGTQPPAARDGGLDVAGWHLEPDTVAAVGAIDLRTLLPAGHPVPCPARPGVPALRALVMDDAGRAEAGALAARLAASGCAVTTLPFPGRAGFLSEPVTATAPHDAFAALCGWIGFGEPADTDAGPPPPAMIAGPGVIASPGAIAIPGATERPVRFGADGRLFGVLCLPHAPRAGPAVLMINTGFSPHVGDARLSVLLARRLAEAGVASLRMDISGVGDSVLPPGSAATLLYDMRSCADVVAALDLLEAEGLARANVVGLCSGAFLSFHSALADRRIVALDLLNIQQFVWAEDLPSGVQSRVPRRPAGFYAAALLRRRTWSEVLHGRVDVRGVALALLRRPFERAWQRLVRGVEALGVCETRAGQVHRWFRVLSRRGVTVRLWYGDADPGLSELAAQFGRGGRGVRRFPGASVSVLDGADHMLHEPDARAQFLRLVCREIVGWREPAIPLRGAGVMAGFLRDRAEELASVWQADPEW